MSIVICGMFLLCSTIFWMVARKEKLRSCRVQIGVVSVFCLAFGALRLVEPAWKSARVAYGLLLALALVLFVAQTARLIIQYRRTRKRS
jgi:hypothetical protein